MCSIKRTHTPAPTQQRSFDIKHMSVSPPSSSQFLTEFAHFHPSRFFFLFHFLCRALSEASDGGAGRLIGGGVQSAGEMKGVEMIY